MAVKDALWARRYRAARGWGGLTRRQLADKLKLSVETVKRTELGLREPSEAELLHLGRLVEAPEWFMLEGWEPSEMLLEQAAARAAARDAQRGGERPEDRSGHQGEGPPP